MEGQTVSHYRILEKIGQGGMGEVYLAEDTSLERKVALKFLPVGLQTDPVAHKRFIREAKSAAAIDHPFICNIFEVGQSDDGQDFIVMEYVEGQTLKDRLDQGRLPVKEALQIGSEVAQALERAHSVGVIHRDLKPTNIMLTLDGHPKVMDFGLAKRITRDKEDLTSVLTREGTTLGTLAYMSPEQLRGSKVDTRSDVFSLGVVLYEMLTGLHPFSTGTQAETVNAILSEHPSPVSRYIQGTPDLLQHTLQKMLAKQPGERYQTVHEIRTNLTKVMEEITSPTPLAEPEKRPWRQIGLAAGAILVLLIAVLVAVYFFLPSPVEIGKSIAVLPFENLSGDPENEYFSDGLTDTIIANLSKIKDLKVISRTSSMLYRNTEKTPVMIGEELDVTTLLEGTVQRQGKQVRVTAQLINAQEEGHVWSEIYDREINDLFAIQSDIAEQIALAMKVELSSTEKARIEKKPTANLTAYDYYLKGLEYHWHLGKQSNENALGLFKRALEEDPDFAAARAYLGAAYIMRTSFESSLEWLDKGIEEAEMALSVDPDSSEAVGTLCFGYREKGWISKAIEAGKKSVNLNPNDHRAFLALGNAYMFSGQFDKAFPFFRRGLALSPRTAIHHTNVGWVYFSLVEFGKAEQWLQKALDIQPDFEIAARLLVRIRFLSGLSDEDKEITHVTPVTPDDPRRSWGYSGYTAELKGDYETARQYYEKVDSEESKFGLARILWRIGQCEESEKLLSQAVQRAEEWLSEGSEGFHPKMVLAKVHAIRGEKEEAYQQLEEAIERGWKHYYQAQVDPTWDDLREEPRFQQLMAEVKADIEEQRKRVEEMEKEWVR